MKSRGHKISKVASIARAEERRVGQMAGKSRLQLDEQLARLAELNAFRRDYASKASPQPTMSGAHWQDYQSFLGRLDTAVRAQQQVVRDCEKNLAIHRQRWLAKRQRLKSLQRVLDRYESEARLQEARREQKTLDDLSNSAIRGFDFEPD